MITAVRKRATYIPALNSVYLSGFTNEQAEAIKATRERHLGGDRFIGKGVWEVSNEVWALLRHFPHIFIDQSVEKPAPFVLRIDRDDPEGMYHYQDIAAEELRSRENCLLFFDTGTGKTRTALLALSRLSRKMSACIVVGESNLSKGWMKQVQEHFPESADRFIVLNDGVSIPKRVDRIRSAAQGSIFITNIESVRNKALVTALNGARLAVMVLDECQCIIGKDARQTAGMHEIQADFRWALSATPIKNSPIEWHSLLAWLRVMPFDGMATRFREYYAYAVRNKFGQWEYTSFRNEVDLEDLKNLVSIRVEKVGLGLPQRDIRRVPLESDADLNALCDGLQREKRRDWIDFKTELGGIEFRADNPSALFYIERCATAIAKKKVEFVLSMSQERLVVVSCLKFPINFIHSLIPDDSVLYHGDLSQEERDLNLKAFLSGQKRVLLMTRKSGGTGLDGLQKVAHKMVFLDAPENEANFNQCADRLHRIGQEHEVDIYVPQVKDSLDIYSWEHMKEKQGWLERYYRVQYDTE